jgi:hypothetical protein
MTGASSRCFMQRWRGYAQSDGRQISQIDHSQRLFQRNRNISNHTNPIHPIFDLEPLTGPQFIHERVQRLIPLIFIMLPPVPNGRTQEVPRGRRPSPQISTKVQVGLLLYELDIFPASIFGDLLNSLLLVLTLAEKRSHWLLGPTHLVMCIFERDVPKHFCPDGNDASTAWLEGTHDV